VSSQPSPYELIGGAEPLRALVERFYDIMESREEYAGIRSLHPPNTAGSRQKLFMFLSGWTGGPQLYVERFGHPRLRARHLPFPIGVSERDQWLACMNDAMVDTRVPESVRRHLAHAFARTADFMRNQVESI
jgi:hemoglobin